MEFKMFPADSVPASLKDDLVAFVNLGDADRRVIEDWLKGVGGAKDDSERFRSCVRLSGLLPDDFARVAGAVRFVLEAWYRQRIELKDVLADLVLLGLEAAQVEQIERVFRRLEGSRVALSHAGMFDFVQAVGLPSVEDINIICECRPVFGGHAYPPSSTPDRDRYTTIVGIMPLVIFEVRTNDYTNRQRRTAFQLTEQEFVKLRDSMTRAMEQLEVMKDHLQLSAVTRVAKRKTK
jgi:hypothetical protein